MNLLRELKKTKKYRPEKLEGPLDRKLTLEEAIDRKITNRAIICMLTIAFLRLFVVRNVVVNGTSMLPNLHENEKLISNTFSTQFSSSMKRGKIVVVKHHNEDKLIVKRIIGLPGEKIEIKAGEVFVDGERLKENYINMEVLYFDESGALKAKTVNNMEDYKRYYKMLFNDVSVTLKDKEYFVMGDNRFNSTDSRNLGPARLNEIEGIIAFEPVPEY